MPIIARFYGIIIKMFLLGSEHNPPHIHVVYGEHTALFDIQTMELLQCWKEIYRQELKLWLKNGLEYINKI